MIHERLPVFSLGKECSEIGPTLLVQVLLSLGHVRLGADILGKLIHATPTLIELRSEFLSLHMILVGQPYVIPVLRQDLGVSSDIPPRIGFLRTMPAIMELGTGSIGKEMTTGDQSGTAR